VAQAQPENPAEQLKVGGSMIRITGITAPHFVAGIVMADGSAANARRRPFDLLGWSRERIERYCAGKGWRCEEC
jgi:hypothetical protein